MTKIGKLIIAKLHFIIKKCIVNNIDANTKTIKLSDVFLSAQKMVIQLTTYFVFSLPLHHSSQTFQFINISLFKK